MRIGKPAVAAAGLAAAMAIGLGNGSMELQATPLRLGAFTPLPLGEGLQTIDRAHPLTPALSPWERESGCGPGLGRCVQLTQAGGALAAFEVDGDAIAAPLAGLAGDPARGLAIIRDRAVGNCLICHALPLPEELFQGEIGPALGGVGGRLTAGQIRLRLVDQSRINPETLMPPYYRAEGLANVAAEFRGRPALDAQQIEDVVAYLAGLKE